MILITGGLGYIGSHIATMLLEQGKKIVVVDDCSTSYKKALDHMEKITQEKIPYYPIDIGDFSALNEVFLSHKITAVIHMAAKIAPAESIEKPFLYYEVNSVDTLQLLKIMMAHQVHKLIFSSSATLYGNITTFPVAEDVDIAATNPYGRSKIISEWMIEDVQKAYPALQAISLRYFNPLGAHTLGEIGLSPLGKPANIFPYILSVATGKQAYLQVTGGDYNTPDGTGIRDYIHIDDLSRGHIKALEYLDEKPGFDVFNLGTGKGTSVLELIKEFEIETGVMIPYKIVERRPGDVAISYANVDKARKILGFETQKDIADMCRDAWKWQENYPSGYDY